MDNTYVEVTVKFRVPIPTDCPPTFRNEKKRLRYIFALIGMTKISVFQSGKIQGWINGVKHHEITLISTEEAI